MQLYRHHSPLTIKASDAKSGMIEGLGSVFGNIDDTGDVVMPGAFKDSLESGRKVAMLYQHRSDQPIGVWDSMKETDEGLLATGRIAVDTQLGGDVFRMLKMGALDGLSIGFRVPKGGALYDPETGMRQLNSIELWELSVVTFPANTEARIAMVKSAEDVDRLDLPGIERLLREAGLSRDASKWVLHRHATLVRQREAEEQKERELAQAMDSLLRSIKG